MTDEEIEDFCDFYKNVERLPNPKHEPLSFKHYLKIWSYYTSNTNFDVKKKRIDIKV